MISDLRLAGRKLGRSPGFTTVAIVTLALGIGANTAMFSLINAVLLRPLPFPEAERLVLVHNTVAEMPQMEAADHASYLDWRNEPELFAEVAATERTVLPLNLPGSHPRSIRGLNVTAGYLRTLGLQPLLGRDFREEDNALTAAPVVLLTHALWQSQFGGDPEILGRSLRVGGRLATVVGVLPSVYQGSLPNERPPELLQALQLDPRNAHRGKTFLQVIARLAPSKQIGQVNARLQQLAEQIQREHNVHYGAALLPLPKVATRDVRGRLYILSAATGLILLIACTNVANLLLIRITGRCSELSVKIALGATRLRLGREILAESLLLGLAGGAAGCAVAAATLHITGSVLRHQFPTFSSIGLDWPALGFSLALTLTTAVIFGLLPAWRATSAWEYFMRSVGRGAGSFPNRQFLNRIFIGVQVALTVTLLVGAGLLLRSMQRILTQDNGFNTGQITVAGIFLPVARYGDRPVRREFFERLLANIRHVPGIELAVAADSIPLSAGSFGPAVIRGRSWPRGQEPTIDKASVGPDYFRTLGIPLVRGREFSAADNAQAPGVVVVNEAFARKFFPDENPIGKEVAFDPGSDTPERWERIVGVVADVRLNALDRDPAPAIFSCYLQSWVAYIYVAVRSPLDQAAVAKIIRTESAALDPELPVSRTGTLQSFLDNALAQRVLITWTIGTAATLALGLALLGVYSIIAYTVAQQTREIGIRLALGATTTDIKRWVARRGLLLVAVGIGAGTIAALLATRLLGTLVYGVPSWDPLTYASVVAAIATMALLACWLPARRAAKVDPMVALRAE